MGVQFFLILPLSLNELVHGIVIHGLGKAAVDFFKFLEQVYCLLNPFLHHLTHAFIHIHQGLLLQIAHGESFGEDGFTIEFLVFTGQNLQQG